MVVYESVDNVVSICVLRITYDLPCKDCVYNGAQCERVKNIFEVKKPYNLKERINEDD